MFCLDIESLSVESTTVILSVALVYFDETRDDHTWESLYRDSIFVKLSAKDQIDNYKRTLNKDTLEWWKIQSDIARNASFTPKKSDLTALEAAIILKKYKTEQSKKPDKDIVWVRGSIDQVAIDSLFNAMRIERLFPFWNYRDVRTFVDFNTETGARGYAEIDPEKYPGIWDKNVVVKHHPVDDICFDVLQILYGK